MNYYDKLMCFLIVLIFVSFGFYVYESGREDVGVEYVSGLEVVSSVGCSSDSMGLTLDCNDTIYGTVINGTDHLGAGNMYVYRKENGSRVVHRLVACVKSEKGLVVKDNDCSGTLVFRGDNNLIGELVNRSQIESDVHYIQKQMYE